jgi:hypothetical protein
MGVLTLVAVVGMALPSRPARAQSGGALLAGKPRLATIVQNGLPTCVLP